jgi:hypothetical protein
MKTAKKYYYYSVLWLKQSSFLMKALLIISILATVFGNIGMTGMDEETLFRTTEGYLAGFMYRVGSITLSLVMAHYLAFIFDQESD